MIIGRIGVLQSRLDTILRSSSLIVPRSPLDLTRFSVFAFMWACQMLEEKSDQFNFAFLTGYAVVLSAILVLFFPNSTVVFLLFCCFQIINCIEELPYIANHYLLITLINVGFVFHFTWAILKASGLHQVNNDRILDSFVPAIQWMVILLYLTAGFHKLNWGYFDIANSCFLQTYFRIRSTLLIFPSAGDSLIWWGIRASVVVEFAIPILLFIRKTRPLALVIGGIFHLCLGLRHPSFSTLMFVLYFLFIPPQFLGVLRQRLKGSGVIEWSYRRLPLVACVTAFALWYIPSLYLPDAATVKDFRHLSWFAMFSFFFAASLFLLSKLPIGGLAAPISWRISWGQGVLLCVLFVNGMSPYLGLKTTTAFSMYSNLRTEGHSNHIIMPKGIIQVVDYQDDLIEIRDSSLPELKSLAEERWRIAFFELQRIVSAAEENGVHNLAVSYLRHGRVFFRESAEEDSELSQKPPWVLKKLVHFRWAPPVGENRCQW